jgi:hypothetical protein
MEQLQFAGQYITFNGSMFNLTCDPDQASDASEELKLFKKMLQLRKKEINEEMRIIRAEASATRAHQGPASLGFGALAFKGSKLGSMFRTFGTIARASQRSGTQNNLSPFEDKKRQIERIAIAVGQAEIALKKALSAA